MYFAMGQASFLGGLHVRFTLQPFISVSLLLIIGLVGLPLSNKKTIVGIYLFIYLFIFRCCVRI